MADFRDILNTYWGYDTFRPLQEDIITSVYEGRDTLALMPTGGGKSLTFQVPSLALEGTCLVITPLIALMKDQVENLKKRGIRAAAIYSGMTRQEIILTLDNCHYGEFKFLYISPERLSTDLFRERVVNMNINLIAVDEAHCISQWGYDFRPSYLNIANIRDLLPDTPVLALTATATPEVVTDIMDNLRFRQGFQVFRKSFARENLAYVVRRTDDKEKELLHILNNVPGSTIIYVGSRKNTKEVAVWLRKHGFTADYFHAGLTNESKDTKQAAWKSDACRIMVATNAFGMGIDKPDVRLVIHLDVPGSIEAYFQEAGRAGRDGKKAFSVLLYQKSDSTRLKKQLSDSYPSRELIRRVYESLAFYFQLAAGTGLGAMFPFDLIDFATTFHYNHLQAYNALKLLEQAGYLELTDELDNPSRVYFTTKRDALYQEKSGDPLSDNLLQVLLRSYTGLFADYIAIQEELLAKRLGCSADQVYQSLLGLSRMGILHYIPRKKAPYIIYTRNREETERVAISKACYEDRRARSAARVEAMLAYVGDEGGCRSHRLLAYFGEQDAEACGQCDVCLSKTETGLNQYQYQRVKASIEAILNEVGPCGHDTLVDEVRRRLSAEAAMASPGKPLLPMDELPILTVIRHLCDEGTLQYDPDQCHFFH
ncbi:MAG: RecQ family ATP-dependent DNA helicase [Bacteroidales bacterium]|nr:RecQ family ATP-dependent DNA helicase [Bacteroidales bacterium]OPZ99967.1 MAG: ATP-dependent DNA helicase RecQ [Bacteroidetes bacterium ADurb.Bin416]